MSYILNILVLYLTSLLTLSTFPNLRIFGVIPLLTLYFVIALAYYRKGFEPILLAALAGIYFDIYSSYPFGLYFFLFTISALIVRYMFQEGMRSLSFWYYLVICGISLFAYYLFQIIIMYLNKVELGTNLLFPIFSGIAVNLVCVILVFAFSNWYFDKLTTFENKLKRR